MRFLASLWVLISPYRSSFVFMDFNGSLCVLIVLFTSVWILMCSYGPYRSLFVFMDSNGSLLVLISSLGAL